MITHGRPPSAFLTALISERRVRLGRPHDDRSPALDSGTGPLRAGTPPRIKPTLSNNRLVTPGRRRYWPRV